MKPIILDTNILFSVLLEPNSPLSRSFFESSYQIFGPETLFLEIFEHKEKIIHFSKIPEAELLTLFYKALKKIHLFKEELISTDLMKQAYDLCQSIDPSDTPVVALTLELRGLLWTGDKKLKKSLKAKKFNHFFEINS